MAVAMFLKIDGIDGESEDSNHKGEIDVLSWSWGATQSGTMHSGKGGGSGKVSMGDLTINKLVDKATPNLWKECCTGKHFDKATLTCRKAGGESLVYYKLDLKGVLISGMQNGATTDDDRPTEMVSLNFAEFSVEYTPQDEKGGGQGAITGGFEIASNEPV